MFVRCSIKLVSPIKILQLQLKQHKWESSAWGVGERGDSETWRSNSTVVEEVVMDDALLSAVEKQSTEAASDNLQG